MNQCRERGNFNLTVRPRRHADMPIMPPTQSVLTDLKLFDRTGVLARRHVLYCIDLKYDALIAGTTAATIEEKNVERGHNASLEPRRRRTRARALS